MNTSCTHMNRVWCAARLGAGTNVIINIGHVSRRSYMLTIYLLRGMLLIVTI